MSRLSKDRLLTNIDTIAQYDFTRNKVFGSAYYVFQANNLEIERFYGTVSPTSNKHIDGKTIFRLASMSKPITAIATLILCESGLVALDDTIEKYLPQFGSIHIIDSLGNHSPSSRIPTIRNLLSHTAGIGSSDGKLSLMNADSKKTLDSSLAFYLKHGLDFEPGTAQQYSGTGAFDVLSKIIEIVTGMDYLSFLKKALFDPCGMHDTTFVPSGSQNDRLIQMHSREAGQNVVFPMPDGCIFEDYPCTHYLGGAGLVSTLDDYCNFAKLLLGKGTINGQQLVGEELFHQMCTPQVAKIIMPGLERWGLGVRVIVDDAYPHLPKNSFGWSGAYGSHFWIDPVNEIIAVFMKNSKIDGGSGNESAVQFEEAVYSSFETI